jgi:hypothetical protein
MQKASALKENNRQPVAPLGSNCLDLEVYVVAPGKQLTIRGSKPFKVMPYECFPIVEGVFGPLRIPLPRSPAILNAEYGSQWPSSYVVKNVNGSKAKEVAIKDPSVIKRTIWPSVPLKGCGPFLGAFVGAGCRASDIDLLWRFLQEQPVAPETAERNPESDTRKPPRDSDRDSDSLVGNVR